jgi:hypothetical protein
MVERDVNPLAESHRALSVRFKAAWAFHQLLVGMHRTRILEDFDDRSEAFKSAFETLKRASGELQGSSTSDSSAVPTLLNELESQISDLETGLARTEESISPSQVRRFFQQVRSFDERILIDIIRFYQRIEGTGEWSKDRLDKADLVVSRLAESIAGPDLQGDRTRLRKVLQALAVANGESDNETVAEITSLSATLQDLRSEVKWVKTFDELHESKLVELYRALKHDMGYKLFHPSLLPLVADLNNAFKQKVDELRGAEEERIVSGYRKLLQGPEKRAAGGPELDVALAGLQRQLDDFESRAKTENVRLDELATLGKSLKDVSRRFQDRFVGIAGEDAASPAAAGRRHLGLQAGPAEALVPNLEAVQPFWDELMAALSGLAPGLDAEDASTQGAVLEYRLEAREVSAFDALGGDGTAGPNLERFILAAVALRRRMSSSVDAIQSALSESPGTAPDLVLEEARSTSRMGDAYLKHFSHLVDQAVSTGDLEGAQTFQLLKMRFMREYSGLLNLIPRLSAQASLHTEGFPVEAEDLDALSAGSFKNDATDEEGD